MCRYIRRGLSHIAADMERYWSGTPAVVVARVPQGYRTNTGGVPDL
ncbi:hypothetical protein [Bacteroides caecimuris]|nr:hypothetical protein [Bacteroides caecimuris]